MYVTGSTTSGNAEWPRLLRCFQSQLRSIIIRLTHANVWESMGKPCSCTQFIKSHILYYKSRDNLYQYYKSRENPYQVLQVTRESVSGTTSHVRCVWTCNEIEGSYDKIIITIAPSYTGKSITRLLPLALLLVLRTRNNTDGNKLVIFSGIASYCGDNYILSMPRPNHLTRKGSGVTSLNPWACGSVEALQLLV